MDCCSCLVLTQEFAQGAKRSNVSRTEGHGKAGLIRILFSVCVGEFRGWSLIPRDPRLDVAGRNRLSGFVRILVAAVFVCVPASGIANPPLSRPRPPGIGFVSYKQTRIHTGVNSLRESTLWLFSIGFVWHFFDDRLA